MAVKVLIMEDNPVARSFLCRVVRESFSDAIHITEAGDLETADRTGHRQTSRHGHHPYPDQPALQREEQFGRKAQNPARTGEDQRAIGRRLRAAQPCLWTNPGRSAAVAPQLSVGTAMVGVQDMQAARQRFARQAAIVHAAGHPAGEGRGRAGGGLCRQHRRAHGDRPLPAENRERH